jgi:hypothetical protein
MENTYHPLVHKILYSKTKTPWSYIKDECKLDKNGNIDIYWANSLDEEQWLRLEIAAFIQKYFEENKNGNL